MYENTKVVMNICENFDSYVLAIMTSVINIDGLFDTHVKLIDFVVYIKPQEQGVFIIELFECVFQHSRGGFI